jgi:hypothetical protein
MTRKYLTSKPAIAAIAFALGITLTGGVAAVAASKPTSVKACVDSHHFLATASKHKCPQGTHALTIGVKGPRGARGSNGAKGSNGLSQVLVGEDLSSTITEGFGEDYVNVLLIPDAPAGNYLVTYTLEIHDTASSGAAQLECQIGNPVDYHMLRDEVLQPNEIGTLSASATITLDKAGPIPVQCHIVGAGVSPLEGGEFATRVNTLTAS